MMTNRTGGLNSGMQNTVSAAYGRLISSKVKSGPPPVAQNSANMHGLDKLNEMSAKPSFFKIA
ncbi:MAG: hypothetical protein WCG95_06395 [bacterium]